MRFSTPLVAATLKRRYKRFLADVIFADGSETTVHVANPGSMLGLHKPGSRVWLSKSENPKRKLTYSWELVEVDFGSGVEFVGVNTTQTNHLVAEALERRRIPQFLEYSSIRREVKYGKRSRVDFLLQSEGQRRCYLEIKSVHMMRKPGLAEFPDAVTTRGAKHLRELAAETRRGSRAVMLFLVQVGSAQSVSIARDIDPAYKAAFDRALSSGVEVFALTCRVTTEGIEVAQPIPVLG